jgi:beta-lactamase superfamily II metal-dependent hydrolase
MIKDSGVPGATTDSPEYRTYMALRRRIESSIVDPQIRHQYGGALLRYMNSHWDDYTDPNEQSIVLKVEYKGRAVMLAGDTPARPWSEKILPFYGDDLKSSILLASHHGSLSFFDLPSSRSYYVEHLEKIKPDMTIVSVGSNSSGLPDKKALEFYKEYSKGSKQGNKVFTTEENGTIKLTLKDEGGWSLKGDQ